MSVFQSKDDTYWFASWETGVYAYDGKTLINYSTKHGLVHNRIDEIKEDDQGNIYFVSCHPSSTVVKFDGNAFTTLTPVDSEDWQLNASDLWFKHSYNTEMVYRYDGTTLHELKLPRPMNLPFPFEIYSIYRDSHENIWFGTNPVGAVRYTGTSFDWITEEDVTEFRDGGANGVRSILEDKNGEFWFNTEVRYRVYGNESSGSDKFYTRIPSIGSLDGNADGDLNEYLSSLKDRQGNLWFTTYTNGVWMYDGTDITHYRVQDHGQDINLFSIYMDNDGELWLGTHQNGAYKFNGTGFEKFTLQ